MEVHLLYLHFTAGNILYNCVCDEYKSWSKNKSQNIRLFTFEFQ